MEEDIKLRSVCDACTAAKLRCNGKTPCERCLKKGIECHYQPFKHRKNGGGNNSSAMKARSSRNPDVTDTFLDEYERRTWSVFFTLYRGFGKGCSLFWFKQQLFRMLRFLETRAGSEASAANALLRLKSWMTALGIDTNTPPSACRAVPSLPFSATTPSGFQATLDDLRNDAQRRNLPMFNLRTDGRVEANEAFVNAFGLTPPQMQKILDDAGGGFLPWSGDILAHVLSRESDLVLYLQAVSNTLDAIGKPTAVPLIHVVPSMSVARMTRPGGQEVLCIIRAVQQLHFEKNDFAFSSTIVFELSDAPLYSSQSGKARPFSETSMANNEATGYEHEAKKLMETEPEDVLPLPQEFLNNPADEEWLDGLLNWATEDQGEDQVLSFLPVADDMLGLHMHSTQHV